MNDQSVPNGAQSPASDIFVPGASTQTAAVAPLSVAGEASSFPPDSGFPFGTILKIIVGLILFFTIAFFLFLFFSSKLKGSGDGKVTLTVWGLWEDKQVMSG